MAAPVRHTIDGDIALLEIENPPVNALSPILHDGGVSRVDRYQLKSIIGANMRF